MKKVSFPTYIGGLIFLATTYLFYHTFDPAYETSILTAGRGPVFFPRIILGAMWVFSLLVIVEGLQKDGDDIIIRGGWTAAVAMVITGVYILSISWAGFVIPTVLFALTLPFVMGYRRWVPCLGIAVGYTLAVWYIFEKVFLIILPSSPWFELI